MNFRAMNMFLSEDNIKRHLAHFRNYKLKMSILEKSIPELRGRTMSEIARMPLDRAAKEEALKLLFPIKAHECFFNSFSEVPVKSETVLKAYPSMENFAYELYLEAMANGCGFLFVYLDRGAPKTLFMDRYDKAFLKIEPLFALDLFEHTYFLDYGFEKERFVRAAIMYLNTARLDT